MKDIERITEAFLKYNSNKEIANSLGVSVRTVQNYKNDTEIKKAISKARYEAVNSAIQKMEVSLYDAEVSLYDAIDILVSIMKDKTVSNQIRLNAINMLLSFSKNWITDNDIEKERALNQAYTWVDMDLF